MRPGWDIILEGGLHDGLTVTADEPADMPGVLPKVLNVPDDALHPLAAWQTSPITRYVPAGRRAADGRHIYVPEGE